MVSFPNTRRTSITCTSPAEQHRAAGADRQQSRGHSGGVNIPLIRASDPTRFFTKINSFIMQRGFFPPSSKILFCEFVNLNSAVGGFTTINGWKKLVVFRRLSPTSCLLQILCRTGKKKVLSRPDCSVRLISATSAKSALPGERERNKDPSNTQLFPNTTWALCCDTPIKLALYLFILAQTSPANKQTCVFLLFWTGTK